MSSFDDDSPTFRWPSAPVWCLPRLIFRVMLYRLHVNSLLRERQVVALVDRFDVDRKGK